MATDRLTQLQDLVHNLEELFAVSLDVLRNPARPAAPTGFEGKPGEGGPAVPPPENVGKVFSRLIVQRAKAIDRFIGFLPTAYEPTSFFPSPIRNHLCTALMSCLRLVD